MTDFAYIVNTTEITFALINEDAFSSHGYYDT